MEGRGGRKGDIVNRWVRIVIGSIDMMMMAMNWYEGDLIQGGSSSGIFESKLKLGGQERS